MPIGIVQFFIPAKGYGFIRIPETREEIYVNFKDVQTKEPLKKGMQVTFDIIEDRHGLKAVQVKAVES